MAFSKAASAAYKQLPAAEKEALKLRSTEQTVTLNAAATKREGDKTFREIQKLVRNIHTVMLLKPAMLASSVQGVVACNATARRVCTLVLFILLICCLRQEWSIFFRLPTNAVVQDSYINWNIWKL